MLDFGPKRAILGFGTVFAHLIIETFVIIRKLITKKVTKEEMEVYHDTCANSQKQK
jgi:hypothetical protein